MTTDDDEIPETHAMLESVFGSTFLAHAIKPPRSVLGYRLKLIDGEIIDFTSAVMIDGDKFIRLAGYDRTRHCHTSTEVRVANISWVREVTIHDVSTPSRKASTLAMDKNPTNIPGEVKRRGDTVMVDLFYPRCDDCPKSITVTLMDVRAADDIRISYDFDRDGWKIEQASKFQFEADDEVCDEDWQEVAFVQAWGRVSEEDKQDMFGA